MHEVAQRADPAARVEYADIDPVAISHSKAILATYPAAAVIDGDVRDPGQVVGHSVTRRLIDFSQTVGLLLVAVLHFLSDLDDLGGLRGGAARPARPGQLPGAGARHQREPGRP